MKAQIILSALLLLGLANASAQWQNTPAVAADYTRLTKTYNAPQGDAQLTLTVDFPDAYAPYAGEVNQWLVHLADRAFLSGDSFGGLPTDHAALGQFVARKFFRFAAQQVKHDVAEPSPYAYTYSMLVNTQAPTFITYQLETGLQFGAKHTMMGRQLVTFIYGRGEADNDALFRQNKFKAVKEALLKSAFADADFMQSSYVAGQNVTKPSQLRGLFSPAGNDGWDGMVLPPAALTDAGVVFSFTPAAGTPAAKSTYHFTVPYLTLQHCFTNEASQAITTAFPSVFVKPK